MAITKSPSSKQEMTNLEKDLAELNVWNRRMERAFKWLGLTPYPVIYRLISDNTMLDLTTYPMMMPTDIIHWSHGKAAQRQRQSAGNFHVFEAATNMNPSVVWLGVTNTMPMQINVMGHAVGGHVSLCAINYLNKGESEPETALQRFAMWRNKVKKLIADPKWGWEGVEYVLDAAFALENFCGPIPSIPGVPSDDELREQLEQEAETLRERIEIEGAVSVAERKVLERKLKDVEQQLKRHPIRPESDLLGFLINPANTPNLQPEARVLLDIVRQRARYLGVVGPTKYMHEGWSSVFERESLLAPQMGLPYGYKFDLARAWTMHDSQVATRWYTDPYALGVRIWRHIDKKFGYDMPEVEVRRPKLGHDENGCLIELGEFIYDDDGNEVGEKGEFETVTATPRNRDKMFEIARTYDDNRFMNEFLDAELLEEINNEALQWVQRAMLRINAFLAQMGWGPQVLLPVDPVSGQPKLPDSLAGILQMIQIWMQEAEQSEYYHQQMGTPLFPVPAGLMQHMGQVVQMVLSYDKNKHALRRMIIERTHFSPPRIYVVDDGRDTDGVLTLKHEFDPTKGPLLQSECRDTLKMWRRLYGRPTRLLTMEVAQDRQGNPVGDPFPYEYFIEKDTVKERRLS